MFNEALNSFMVPSYVDLLNMLGKDNWDILNKSDSISNFYDTDWRELTRHQLQFVSSEFKPHQSRI